MNKFHNDIKRQVFKEFITEKKSKVLDLASGRGGDLIKWTRNPNVASVRGYDKDKDSVKEAKARLAKLSPRKSIKYFVKDLSKDSLKRGNYDVISIQFAIHYFFDTPQSWDTLLNTIDNTSKPGTVFIVTVLDDEFIKELDTRNINIEFMDVKKDDPFGNKISVWIRDTILDEPTEEFIVDKVFLLSSLHSIGFELIEYRRFKEFYNDSKYKLTKAERDYSFQNSVFVFEKIKNHT